MSTNGTGRLSGRIALVTGASRGIGRAVALRFAMEGAKIVAFARTQGALEELDDEIRQRGGSEATLIAEDLTDFETIDRVGAALYERFEKLDILVGAAGTLGQLSPIGHISPKVWESVFAINTVANWRLIRSFDPLLRQSDAGRAIFVSSGVARTCKSFWGAYAASKAALECLVRIYATEMSNTPLRVNLVDPGAVRTRMRAQAFPGEDPATLKTPDEITDVFVDLATPECTRNGDVVVAQA